MQHFALRQREEVRFSVLNATAVTFRLDEEKLLFSNYFGQFLQLLSILSFMNIIAAICIIIAIIIIIINTMIITIITCKIGATNIFFFNFASRE